MKEKYKISDLKREMRGVRIGRYSFVGALRTSLGDEGAMLWFYHTKIRPLGNMTPHNYVDRRGQSGKECLAGVVYALVTGQPD
ncbi:hypothetical protein FJZ18_02275 [Candidatus Pacearchaeota archaeon]|nr:hypothetical protein [Candidatus Pacearchaeota archaeon]